MVKKFGFRKGMKRFISRKRYQRFGLKTSISKRFAAQVTNFKVKHQTQVWYVRTQNDTSMYTFNSSTTATSPLFHVQLNMLLNQNNEYNNDIKNKYALMKLNGISLTFYRNSSLVTGINFPPLFIDLLPDPPSGQVYTNYTAVNSDNAIEVKTIISRDRYGSKYYPLPAIWSDAGYPVSGMWIPAGNLQQTASMNAVIGYPYDPSGLQSTGTSQLIGYIESTFYIQVAKPIRLQSA